MEALILIFIFIFGSLIGSFLNVCIYRIPKEESIAFPPSHCGNCNHQLKAKDLVPIFSYLFLKGKCRYCNEKVSMQYPLIEALTGILYVGLFLTYGFSYETLVFCALTSILIVIAMIDFKTQYIYDSTIIVGIIIGIIYLVLSFIYKEDFSLLNTVIGIAIPTIVLALIVGITGAMGWGDVELIFVVSMFLSIPLGILNLFLSIVIGGIIAGVYMIAKLKSLKSEMAFGPAIVIATYFTLIWGENILNWYINTFII